MGINEVKKGDLAQNLTYALTLQFIDRMEKNGKINSDEKHRLKDDIETKEGNPKVGDATENIWKELKRLKVVDNRDNVWNCTKHNTHYTQQSEERFSRYGKWQ